MWEPSATDIGTVLNTAGFSGAVVEPVGADAAGATTWTFRVDNEWIVQVARYEPVVDALHRQTRLMPVVRDAVDFAVPVPELIGEWAGCPVFRYRAVPGRRFTVADDPRELARAVDELHAVPTAWVSEVLGQCSTLHGWWQAQERFCAEVERALLPQLDRAMRAAVSAEFDWFFAQDWDFEPVLVHSDLSGAHVLLDDAGTLAGVLDFDWAGIGDPVIDFVGVHDELGQHGTSRVVASYGGAFSWARLWFYWWLNPCYPLVYAGDWLDAAAFRAGVADLRARLVRLGRLSRTG